MRTELEFLDFLKEQAEEGLKLWESPSVAMGIIKDGRVVFKGGFGKRDVEAGLPATENTMYQMASCTKAFTAALVAIMVDQGKLSWDEPLIKYLPHVRFYEDYTTSNLTLRDILCHRSGLPRHEYSWYGSDFTKDELIFNLRYLEPNKPIRTKFQYNNYGFILAGHAVEKVTGKSWEECVEEYILKPLGMDRTNMFIDAIKGDGDHAEPYDRNDPATDILHGAKKIPFYKMPDEDFAAKKGSPLGPAGTINSCVEDMLKWVELHLNGGEIDGQRIISEAAMAEMHRPNMLLPKLMDMPHEETKVPAYGMGWFVENFRGMTLVQHGGNLNGFSAWTSFIPELKLGVVSYTNMNNSALHRALAREVYDHYIGVESGNWVKRYHDYYVEQNAKLSSSMAAYTGEKVEGTTWSHPLEDYAGKYVHDGYMPVVVRYEDGKLLMKLNDCKTELKHFHYDTFVTSDIMGGGEVPPGLPVTFHGADFRKEIASLAMPLCFEEGAEPVRFKKQKD